MPHSLKDQLSEVASEVAAIVDKLTRLHKNGQLIIERTHNYSERDLVQSTCTTLTDQLDQIQNLLQRKKQAVSSRPDKRSIHKWRHTMTLFFCECFNCYNSHKPLPILIYRRFSCCCHVSPNCRVTKWNKWDSLTKFIVDYGEKIQTWIKDSPLYKN